MYGIVSQSIKIPINKTNIKKEFVKIKNSYATPPDEKKIQSIKRPKIT